MSLRIRIADAELDIRRLIAFILRRKGVVVVKATEGNQALPLIQDERAGLAVLDVMLPGMTGR